MSKKVIKITLHLEGTKEEIAQKVLDFTEILAGEAGNVSTGGSASAAPKGKDGGKDIKSVKPTKEEATEIDDDLGFEEPPAKEEEEEAPAMSRDDFVVAVRDYAKKKDGNKAKVKAALDKLKIKSVQDVKEKDFEAFLKGLK